MKTIILTLVLVLVGCEKKPLPPALEAVLPHVDCKAGETFAHEWALPIKGKGEVSFSCDGGRWEIANMWFYRPSFEDVVLIMRVSGGLPLPKDAR